MTQYRSRDGADVFQRHGRTAIQDRAGLARQQQRLPRTRTCAPPQPLLHEIGHAVLRSTSRPRRPHQPRGVVDDVVRSNHLAHQHPRALDLFARGNRRRRRIMPGCRLRQDLLLVAGGRVVDDDVKHEPVELGFRQWIRALLLDGVLRGEHEQRPLQRVAHATNRDLVFLHRLEEGRLRLGRRPVDLVRENDVCEDWSRNEANVARAGGAILLDHLGADDVGRHQVRRELDAAELQVHRLRECFDQQRLRQSRHTPQ